MSSPAKPEAVADPQALAATQSSAPSSSFGFMAAKPLVEPEIPSYGPTASEPEIPSYGPPASEPEIPSYGDVPAEAESGADEAAEE